MRIRLVHHVRRTALAGVLLVPLVGYVATSRAEGLPELGDISRAEFSPATEYKIGQSIMNDIQLHESTYIDDPDIHDYLDQLGRRLFAGARASDVQIHLFPLRDPAINAFAMFGGFIGVNSGLILAVDNESELAGVIAHEISHVTQRHLARQIVREKQVALPALAAMALAVLAARSNSDLANAAMATTQGALAQSQLAFTRDFEREADRAGFELLDRSGFDVRGMAGLFARLQSAGRYTDHLAPSYLRTHPMTTERMADMQNRSARTPYRQVLDSVEFTLVRARLDAEQGTPGEAVQRLSGQLQSGKYASALAVRYGLVVAYLRDQDAAAARRALAALEGAAPPPTAMIDGVAADVLRAAGEPQAARRRLEQGLRRFPDSASLKYRLAELLIAERQGVEARRYVEGEIRLTPGDPRLHRLLAKAEASLGRQGAQHKAQAEAYLLQGSLPMAVEQLELAQRSPDNDFFEQSVIDARLRELKAQLREERRRER